MPLKKLWIYMILSWCDKFGIGYRLEIPGIVFLSDILLQTDREQHTFVISETDESFVESLVVEGG